MYASIGMDGTHARVCVHGCSNELETRPRRMRSRLVSCLMPYDRRSLNIDGTGLQPFLVLRHRHSQYTIPILRLDSVQPGCFRQPHAAACPHARTLRPVPLGALLASFFFLHRPGSMTRVTSCTRRTRRMSTRLPESFAYQQLAM